MSSTIGMMDPAYFVGRKEIVDWINGTLQLSLSKVEQTASGAVACQLLDRMYPGMVPMQRVNWEAKADYEFINNYKILQHAFDKLKIDKHIDIEKLVRAKYQDNLEFMQWFKRFYELRCPAGDYDAVARRASSKGQGRLNGLLAPAAASSRPTATGRQPTRTQSSSSASSHSAAKPSGGGSRPVLEDKENAMQAVDAGASAAGTDASSSAGLPAANKAACVAEGMTVSKHTEDNGLMRRVEVLTQENTQLQSMVEALEKERDFYFQKLTMVEQLLQDKQAEDEKEGQPPSELVNCIFKILYATENERVDIVMDAPGTDDDVQGN